MVVSLGDMFYECVWVYLGFLEIWVLLCAFFYEWLGGICIY